MLVLSRKTGEEIVIGRDISVVVRRISGNRVAIGIDAPRDVRVLRGELQPYADAFDTEAEEEATRCGPAMVPTVTAEPQRVAIAR